MTQLTARRVTASTDHVELAYWVHYAPRSNGRFLLLIHGGASNHTRWSEFVETTALNPEWNIIVPDMRGNAESMTRKHINLSAWTTDLTDLLAAENTEDAVILGHSLGAQIAIHFADRYKSKTRGLILIDPIFQSSLQGKSLWVRRCRWLVHLMVAVILLFNSLGLRRRNFGTPDLRELDRQTREEIRGASSFEEIEKRYTALGPILRNMPIANYLRQALATVTPLPPFGGLDMPVLALLSGGTTVGDINLNRRQIDGFLNHEIVILDANHWPLTESPDAVRQAIDEWAMRTWPSGNGAQCE